MVSKSKKPHFGHESMHTHSQSVEAAVVEQSKATAESILSSKGHDVISVRPTDTIHKVTEVMKEHGIGSVLVKDQNGHMVGILTERDIVRGFADEPDDTFDETAADLMTKEVITATPDTPLLDLLRSMSEGRFRHIPVLDGEHIAGLISIGDVVKFRLRELEYEALKLKQMIVG
ncbi:CBS domain-containing protein [Aliiruegeria lutimaris]|uniref:CBS domain-containing protein n=1 Tax=Aliiruegeria lutimaris TaxID=571298 RepID=A0A1G9FMJ7_9RHOB|nr:CBS domain-containing protein [Aliiruegeria lutimaris]SDK89614.1 CBS domain-containing protein [Aliiruegeria lutimaris]